MKVNCFYHHMCGNQTDPTNKMKLPSGEWTPICVDCAKQKVDECDGEFEVE